MLRVIKNKGTTVKAYQLGSNHEIIKKLMEQGKIRDLGEGTTNCGLLQLLREL